MDFPILNAILNEAVRRELDYDFSLEEIKPAIHFHLNGKASGLDEIGINLYKDPRGRNCPSFAADDLSLTS